MAAVGGASNDDDLDFMGEGSMKDLAMRMDEIDKEIDAIAEVEKGTPKKRKEEAKSTFYETPEKAAAGNAVEDVVAEDNYDDDGDDNDEDDGDAGLEDLQKEMEQFEALQQEQGPATVSATAVKPTLTSPIGISMKTKKGITRIVSVNPTGLLANSELRAGYQLIQVNGINIKNAKHAQAIIQNDHASITLVAKSVVTIQQ